MFENTRAFSGFAVDDLDAAKKFYGEVLGLKTSEQYGLLTLHLAGGRDTLVYPKPDHAPATYTILNFATRASTGPADPTSPGSRTRPATSSPSCRNADAHPAARLFRARRPTRSGPSDGAHGAKGI